MTHHQDRKRFFFVFVLRLTATFLRLTATFTALQLTVNPTEALTFILTFLEIDHVFYSTLLRSV